MYYNLNTIPCKFRETEKQSVYVILIFYNKCKCFTQIHTQLIKEETEKFSPASQYLSMAVSLHNYAGMYGESFKSTTCNGVNFSFRKLLGRLQQHLRANCRLNACNSESPFVANITSQTVWQSTIRTSTCMSDTNLITRFELNYFYQNNICSTHMKYQVKRRLNSRL